MKRIITVLAVLLATTLSVFAGGNEETIEIKTSSVCEMCKETIEGAMAYEKGVKKAILNVKTGVLTVTYNTKKTNPDAIRKAVTMVGYDADDIPADPKAYEALHGCCKKDAH